MIEINRRNKLTYWVIIGVFLAFLLLTFIVSIFYLPKKVSKKPEVQFQEAIKKDQSACDKIRDESSRRLCHYYFTLRKAVAKRNISLCDNLTEDFIKTCQNNYYFQVAQEEKNLSLCPKITYLALRKQCEEEVTKLIESEKSEVQEKTNNLVLSICGGIENKETKRVCQNLLSLENFPTADKCNGFQDEASRKICLEIAGKKNQIEKMSLQEAQQIVCGEIEEANIQSICFDFFQQLENFKP